LPTKPAAPQKTRLAGSRKSWYSPAKTPRGIAQKELILGGNVQPKVKSFSSTAPNSYERRRRQRSLASFVGPPRLAQ
jgi:hypothetical protein